MSQTVRAPGDSRLLLGKEIDEIPKLTATQAKERFGIRANTHISNVQFAADVIIRKALTSPSKSNLSSRALHMMYNKKKQVVVHPVQPVQ